MWQILDLAPPPDFLVTLPVPHEVLEKHENAEKSSLVNHPKTRFSNFSKTSRGAGGSSRFSKKMNFRQT